MATLSDSGEQNPFVHYVRKYESVLEPSFCASVISKLDRTQGVAGRVGAQHVDLDQKTSIDFDVATDPQWRGELRVLERAAHRLVRAYGDDVKQIRDLGSVSLSGFRIRRYPEGGKFDWHFDEHSWETSDRLLALVFFLNNVETGGELEFLHLKPAIEARIGRAAVFPTAFPFVHRSRSNQEPKYIAVCFALHSADGNLNN